jgi:Putative peptidoglycan binding domain
MKPSAEACIHAQVAAPRPFTKSLMTLNNLGRANVQLRVGKMGVIHMKRTLLAVCIGTLALAMGAAGQDNQNTNQGGRKARAAAKTTSQANATGARRSTPVTTRQQFHQRSNFNAQNTSARVSGSNARFQRSETARPRPVRAGERTQTNVAAQNNVTTDVRRGRNFQRERTVARTGERNFAVNRGRNVAVNRERNFAVNRERNFNRTRNVTIVNNWRGDRFTGRPYVAFRNYHRQWHDRDWWRGHFDRIIFVSGGWYFWNGGFWYPAWGYDPGYYYPYDGPIYGYGDLTPDQIVVNVQQQLQRDGYYDGPIDGVLGPQTREAIAEFQADHGLAVTSAIDEPTLNTLGLV